MTYREAFKIGSAVEGYVKCTYARLHNAEYGVMFSLQRRNTTTNSDLVYLNDAIGVPENFNIYAGGVEFPVVKSDLNVGDEKFVPVRLTDAGKETLLKLLSRYQRSRKIVKTNIYVECHNKVAMPWNNVYNPTEWTVGQVKKVRVIEGSKQYSVRAQFYSNHNLRLENYDTTDYPLNPIWFRYYWDEEISYEPIEEIEDLLRVIENKEECYVLASAIDWAPLNIENATITDENGEIVNLNIAVEQAENKLKQAKTLLALSAAATLI